MQARHPGQMQSLAAALPQERVQRLLQQGDNAVGGGDQHQIMRLSAGAAAAAEAAAQPPEPILLMTVDIGDGRKDVVEVREGDDPGELARQFCSRNKLQPSVVDVLSRFIEQKVASLPATSSPPAGALLSGGGR